MKARTVNIIGINVLVFLGLVLLVEAVGQVIAVIRPSYDVLALQPDRVLGWKQVPNLRWPWAGHSWYAADFSVEVDTNPLGFRDVARALAKPAGVKRVALLGDSFIEAVQVPFAKTAAQLLERKLNLPPDLGPQDVQRWEVLNFGISNFGVGQYLLTWEEYARRHHPDYVVIFVAKFHMKRTVDKYEYGAFTATAKEKLWIRPTFRLENGSLLREPAEDYDRFVRIVEDLMKVEFSGARIQRKRMRLLTLHYGKQLFQQGKDLARRVARRFGQTSIQMASSSGIDLGADGEVIAVNLKIIEELGRQVHIAGSRLVVVDASQYFGDNQIISKTLNEFCTEHGFGYIPLYVQLLGANRHGVSTRWATDGHFNNDGNMILAQSLYDWIAQAQRAQ